MAFPGRRVFKGGRQEGEQGVLNGKGREQPKSQLGGKKHQGKGSKGVMGRGHSSSPLLDLQPQRLCAVHHMQRKGRQCPSAPSIGSRATFATLFGAEAALKQLPLTWRAPTAFSVRSWPRSCCRGDLHQPAFCTAPAGAGSTTT